MYNNFKVCRFFIKFCVPSFIPDMFKVLINQPMRVSLPSFRTVSVLPGNRRESKGLTKADSVQATWVGSLTMWNRERVVTANYWTTPAPEIKAIASHGRTGLGLKAVGAWKERLRGWRMGGWKKGDGSDLKLQRQGAQEGSMSDFLGGDRSLRLANPRGQTTPLSQEEGTHWCLDGTLLLLCGKLKECPLLTSLLYSNANAQISTPVWFHKYGLKVYWEFC